MSPGVPPHVVFARWAIVNTNLACLRLGVGIIQGTRQHPSTLDTAQQPKEFPKSFSASGLKKTDISILSDEFLAEVQQLPYKNIAVELLGKLLKGEINTRRKKNVVQSRSCAEMFQKSFNAYHSRGITTQDVVDHLIKIAKEMRDVGQRGLNDDETAFYDALAANEIAVDVMGDEQLAIIARELLGKVKANLSIDWTIKERVRSKIRVLVRCILKRYGYPPDLQEAVTQTVQVAYRMWIRNEGQYKHLQVEVMFGCLQCVALLL